jgi:hypothetical protein
MRIELEPFVSPKLTPLDSSLWGWMNNEVNKRKLDTRNKFIAHIFYAVA